MSEGMSVLRKLFAAFPNSQASKETIAVYVEFLAEVPLDELRAIVGQCIVECTFLPTVGEIMERHRNMTGALAQETAAEQWGKVQQAMREVGYVGRPNFTDPITAQIVRQWGWENLCASEDGMVDRAHFLKMYTAIAERHEKIAKLTPASRQIAEQRGGLKPLGEIMQLPERKREATYEN